MVEVVAELGTDWVGLDGFKEFAIACVNAGADKVKGQFFLKRHIRDHPYAENLSQRLLSEDVLTHLLEWAEEEKIFLFFTK